MTRMMVGPLLLLAASVSPPAASASPDSGRAAAARNIRATAHATATIRIVSGVRFGRRYVAVPVAGAERRSTQLADADGTIFPSELLEFQ